MSDQHQWRGSRPDMLSYDAATGEQVSFIYLPSGDRLEVGGGGDPVAQAAAIIAAQNAALSELQSDLQALRAALTASAETKAAYMGEFRFRFPILDADGKEVMFTPNVPWTTIKEIMAAISVYATNLSFEAPEGGEAG